ncbi:MAG: dihydropteroate synthase [Burkholderiaceae bacterium]|nr:dihydropteroate synthase [Burkholderiaceae bacterium]MCD6682053.1 dihydropteroate synthase [Burkholderiaceae bacterium]
MNLFEPARRLRCGRFVLDLDRPLVMGVVNVTPDSFSDGGRYATHEAAVRHAHRLIEEGADLLDIGGESTRPGAAELPADEEIRRIVPVLDALRDCGLPLSVDTRRAETMRVALEHGADLVNDIGALRAPGAIDAVRGSDCAVCLMHMQGEPGTMQQQPKYGDVVGEVEDFLAGRVAAAVENGIARERIVVDPGIGFGKTLRHNLQLLAALDELAALAPVLVGVSRKSMIGNLTGRDVDHRLAGSLSAMLAAAMRGARILRVHDVAESRDALRVWQAIDDAQ